MATRSRIDRVGPEVGAVDVGSVLDDEALARHEVHGAGQDERRGRAAAGEYLQGGISGLEGVNGAGPRRRRLEALGDVFVCPELRFLAHAHV